MWKRVEFVEFRLSICACVWLLPIFPSFPCLLCKKFHGFLGKFGRCCSLSLSIEKQKESARPKILRNFLLFFILKSSNSRNHIQTHKHNKTNPTTFSPHTNCNLHHFILALFLKWLIDILRGQYHLTLAPQISVPFGCVTFLCSKCYRHFPLPESATSNTLQNKR